MKTLSGVQPLWRRLLRPLVILLVVNAAVFAVYTLPRTLQERSVSARDATLRADVAREREVVAQLRRRAETLKANTRDRERFYSEIVGDRGRDLVATIEEVEKMAVDLGLKPQTRAWEHSRLHELPVVRTVIRMPLRGTYAQLVAFLDRVERSKRFLIVEQVSLKEGSDGQGDLLVAVGTYFRADADEGRKS
jgi:Tfp pilus assembly protein PilO